MPKNRQEILDYQDKTGQEWTHHENELLKLDDFCPDAAAKIEQVMQANAAARHFVFVCRTDAPTGGADGIGTTRLLTRAVELDMRWQDQRAAGRNAQPLEHRHALLGLDRGWTPVLSKAVYMAEFGEGRDISDAQVLSGILSGLGLDPQEVIAEAQSETNKTRLRRLNDEALSRGVFGAPAFIAEDGEMFWGNDRLEQALDWAATQARRSEIPL